MCKELVNQRKNIYFTIISAIMQKHSCVYACTIVANVYPTNEIRFIVYYDDDPTRAS